MRKNRKKLVWLLVALCMLLASSGAVYAEGEAEATIKPGENGTNYKMITANGYRVAAAEEEVIISVDLKWGEMAFKYVEATPGTWNPVTHLNDGAEGDYWVASGNTITVENHSNVSITAGFSFTDSTYDLTHEYSQIVDGVYRKLEMPTAGDYAGVSRVALERGTHNGTAAVVDSADVALTITDGSLPKDFTTDEEKMESIGTVTVLIFAD